MTPLRRTARVARDFLSRKLTPGALKIGVSARLFHPQPDAKGIQSKTLQYLEQSVAHWVLRRGVLLQEAQLLHDLRVIGAPLAQQLGELQGLDPDPGHIGQHVVEGGAGLRGGGRETTIPPEHCPSDRSPAAAAQARERRPWS